MQIVKLSRAVAACSAALALYRPAMAITGVETQLTTNPGGHILTNLHLFSPDGQWIVFDERSDAEGAKFDSATIRRVYVASGKVETLYESRNGAYAGGVTYNPKPDDVVFIHGPENPTATSETSASACPGEPSMSPAITTVTAMARPLPCS